MLKQNNQTQARAYLDQAIELDPLNREAQELMKPFQTQSAVPTVQSTPNNQTKNQQSIMFQKPEPKKTNPLTGPRK